MEMGKKSSPLCVSQIPGCSKQTHGDARKSTHLKTKKTLLRGKMYFS